MTSARANRLLVVVLSALATLAFLALFVCMASEGDGSESPAEAAANGRQQALCVSIALPLLVIFGFGAWWFNRRTEKLKEASSVSPAGASASPPGWYSDDRALQTMRWWDGSQWTAHVIVPIPDPPTPLRVERFCAVLSHIGVVFGGPLTPLVVWAASPKGSLRRQHGRQAFAYQMVYLPIYVFVLVKELIFANRVESVFVCIGVGLALAVPQMIRAAMGKPPWPWPPFFRLRH